MNYVEKFGIVIYVIVFLGILKVFFGWSPDTISMMTEWSISIGIGIVLSGISGEFVELLSGDFFKKIFRVITIGPFDFSISLFAFITIIVKFWLFS